MGTCERLSALDAAFVKLDRMGAPYVVASVLVFDRRPLLDAGGDLDRDTLREYVGASLDRIPRYRQRLGKVPLLRHPAWIDDTDFDLAHHLRFLDVEPPGGPAELDALVGRLLGRPLDTRRPPWEMWIIDHLAGEQVALVTRLHHSLVDGVAGMRVLQELLRGVPDPRLPPRLPRSAERPSRLALLRDELAGRIDGLRHLKSRIPGDPRRLAPALGKLIRRGLQPASDAGINPLRIGRRRAIARLGVPLADLSRAAHAHGATVNDAVLAAIAGALRVFLLGRGVDVERLEDFRAMVPASTHARDSTTVSGNRVALMLARLPLDEPDPFRRLARVHAVTDELKTRNDEVAAGELLVQLSDVTIPSLLPAILALSLAQRGFNVVITNIPGPPFPLYLLGARLLSLHPVVNLWPRQTIGVAVLSYQGTLSATVSADPDAVPDLQRLVRELERAFAELLAPAPESAGRKEPPCVSASPS
jgi:WS/DGAT/MGAT family acyltransferase